MKAFSASFETLILRYYLMMAVIIIPFFIGIPALALLGFPLFFISLIGLSFKKGTSLKAIKTIKAKTETKQAA